MPLTLQPTGAGRLQGPCPAWQAGRVKYTVRALRLPLAAMLLAAAALSGCSGPAPGIPDTGLNDPAKKRIAMRPVSSAENSSLDWEAQYPYIEDIGDGRGYTAGITGLGKPFTRAWAKAAEDPAFRAAQEAERDTVYFGPAVRQAEEDGLGALGQFIYYDAYVMHGAGDTEGTVGFRTMRREAMAAARTPARGGDEKAYLNAFLDARVAAMVEEPAHSDTSRVETAQRVFVREGKLRLETPLRWKVYGDAYRIEKG